MIRTTLAGFVFACSLALAATPAPAQPEQAAPVAAAAAPSLRLTAVAGDVLRYKWTESTWQRTAPIETPEGGQVREGSLEVHAAFAVKEVKEAGVTLELTFERIRVSAKVGDRDVAYDSANPGPKPPPMDGQEMERPFESSIKPLIGHPVTVTLDATGRIAEISNVGALLDMTAPTARFGLLLMSIESLSAKFGSAFTAWQPEPPALTWQSQQMVPYVPGILFDVAFAHEAKTLDGGITEITATGTPTLKVPNPRRLGTREIKSSSLTYTQRWNSTLGRGDTTEHKQESVVLLKAPEEGPGKQALVTSRMHGRLERASQVEAAPEAPKATGN